MVQNDFSRWTVAAALVCALAACQPGAGGGPVSEAPTEAGADAAGTDIVPGGALTLVARDVEAPDVFSTTEKGLWDGRPSLGGVWVAASNVTDPERVIIRNPANGKSVIGALFRREAANPGPALQISSDAAAALEILAGSPTTVSVTALRREEPAGPAVVEEPLPEIADATEAPAPAAGEAAAGLDPIAATASAALDEAEGKTTDAAPADAAAVVDEGVAAEAAAPEAPKKRRGLFAGLFGRKQADAPLDATGGAATGAIAETALPDAGEPIPGGTIGSEPAAGAEIATATIPATPVAAGALERPYVQIGIFSVEGNAQRAADQMKAAGMTATVKTDSSNGKTFWRVIVGPAASVEARNALAASVKGMGYPDAYPVKG